MTYTKNKILAIFFIFIININLSSIVVLKIYEDNIANNVITINSNEYNVDKIINFSMKLGKIPSVSTCILNNNEIVWYKGYGLCNIEKQTKPDINTIYMIASISKSITATALMKLYEQDFFDLDEDINSYLPFEIKNPYFPNVNITFRMLLSHTSSLGPEPDYYHYVEYDKDPDPLNNWIKDYFYENGTLKTSNWNHIKPGNQYQYNSIDYCLIGYLIEQMTNKTFNQYCKETIFQPLLMNNSSFLLSNIDRNKTAIPYMLEDGSMRCKYFFPLEYYSWRMYPAGNMMSSIEDLSHFLIMHMNNGEYKGIRVLNETTTELMHLLQTPKPHVKSQYGLGFQIWPKITETDHIGHDGALYGYNSKMKFRSSKDSGIIFFINRAISNEIQGKIALLLIEKALWKMVDQIY